MHAASLLQPPFRTAHSLTSTHPLSGEPLKPAGHKPSFVAAGALAWGVTGADAALRIAASVRTSETPTTDCVIQRGVENLGMQGS